MEGVQVIMIHTRMGDAEPKDLEDFFKTEGYTVKFEEEFEDNDGHNHIIFSVLDNIPKFCLYRIMRNDLKWLDDWHMNRPESLPKRIIKKYSL